MKARLRKMTINFITSNKSLSPDEIEILEYGFDSFYIAVSKLILIGIITIALNMFYEFILFFIFYGILRSFSFGAHASKSWICNIMSTTIYIIIPLTCNYIVVSKRLLLLISLLFVVIFILFSPADTSNHPIVSNKRRFVYKIITVLTSLIYMVFIVYSSSTFISNALAFSIVVQGIMVLPITYCVLGQPYNNYKRLEGGIS